MTSRRAEALGGADVRRSRPRDHRGMVTVELAVGFVTITFLTATLAVVVLLGVVQSACATTSTGMARQLARGDAAAAAAVRDVGPADSDVRVTEETMGVTVTISAAVPILGMGNIVVTAQRWAAWEPGVGSASSG